MRSVYTLIFIGLIGFTVYAQSSAVSTGNDISVESMVKSFSGSSSTGMSVGDFVDVISEQLTETAGSTEQQRSAIEGSLFIKDIVPDANQATAEAVDSKTGRYPPRLKIDFTEFPLRTWTLTSRTDSKHNADFETTDIVRRIKSRLHLSQIHFVIEDRTVTVSGTVATDQQKNRVENMLRFEPGIDTVQNKITVSP